MSLIRPSTEEPAPTPPVRTRDIGLTSQKSGDTGLGAPSLQQFRVSGMCLYGAHQLVPKIDALIAEMSGVKEGEDIEYIHRMRVASRRLRAAMPLFDPCFPVKKYEGWLDEVRQITRVLGEARDIDVQVAFLKKFRKRAIAHQKLPAGRAPPPAPGTLLIPGIDYLLADLKKQRISLQKDVIASVERLERRQGLSALRGMAQSMIDRSGTGRKKPPVVGIPPVAADHIGRHLDELLFFSPWVHHADAIAEHHAMRIAAKKLRYTMEVYAALYRLGLRKPTGRVTQLQEMLGNLHDCDVWIDRVTRILLKERTRLRPVAESNRPTLIEITSLKLFLVNRERERTALYRKFVRYWDSLGRFGTWNDLRQVLVNGVKKQYLQKDTDIEAARLVVMQLAMVHPEGLLHSRRVTEMALTLFDDLIPLHQMNEHCRFLLECAGMLHDIGWKSGRKGHESQSRKLILSDESLPFGVAERSTISLVAGTHQGSQCPPDHSLFSVLSPDDQRCTNLLSALLRIADGLDFRHKGAVESAHCFILPDRVECVITPTQDVLPEKQKAGIKAEFFEKVFGIPFYIV